MNKQEYHLVLPVKLGPSSYGGGWGAGSVIAHWFHLKKGNPGVFWVWPLSSSGIKREHKALLDTWKVPMGIDLQVGGKRAHISSKGFFYESNTHSIEWQFEAEYIIRTWPSLSGREKAEKELERLKCCISRFRQEYLHATWYGNELWGDWLLIRKLQKLKKPIKGQSINGGYSFEDFNYFSNPNGKVVSLSSYHLRGGTAFILECPEELELVEPDPEKVISSYLKQFLTDNPPRSNLREINVHNVFLLRLLKEGYFIVNEGKIAGGRFDVLFKDKNENLIAIEFKLRQGDTAVDQLKDYIKGLQKDHRAKIHGAIVCGKADEELHSRANKKSFKVIEYNLILDIPFQELTI